MRVRSYLEHAVIQCPLSRTTVYPLALLDHTCEPRRIDPIDRRLREYCRVCLPVGSSSSLASIPGDGRPRSPRWVLLLSVVLMYGHCMPLCVQELAARNARLAAETAVLQSESVKLAEATQSERRRADVSRHRCNTHAPDPTAAGDTVLRAHAVGQHRAKCHRADVSECVQCMCTWPTLQDGWCSVAGAAAHDAVYVQRHWCRRWPRSATSSCSSSLTRTGAPRKRSRWRRRRRRLNASQ